MDLKEFESKILKHEMKLDDSTIKSYHELKQDLFKAFEKLTILSRDQGKGGMLTAVVMAQAMGALKLSMPKTYKSVIDMANNYSLKGNDLIIKS